MVGRMVGGYHITPADVEALVAEYKEKTKSEDPEEANFAVNFLHFADDDMWYEQVFMLKAMKDEDHEALDAYANWKSQEDHLMRVNR